MTLERSGWSLLFRSTFQVLLTGCLLFFAGCDEQFLLALSPEDRQIVERMLGVESETGAAQSDAATAANGGGDAQDPNGSSSQSFISEGPLSPGAGSSGSPSAAAMHQDDQCQTLEVGAPRGLACLHCMQPQARRQAHLLASLLFRSCLKNVALNYLVDGTFSFDPSVVKEHVDLLTGNGRRLFLYFYLTNGATQRRWDETPVGSLGVQIEPERFRDRIQSDPSLQEGYRLLIRRMIPLLRYASQRGAVISLIPSLEDNLDSKSFRAMAELTLDEMPHDIHFALGRNPCPSCYPGNSADIPAGLFQEEHTVSPFPSARNGVITNDGRDYAFGEAASGNRVRLEDLRAVRNAASLLDSTFILWSGERQGLAPDAFGSFNYRDPELRDYQIPTLAERRALLEFLRENVRPFPLP